MKARELVRRAAVLALTVEAAVSEVERAQAGKGKLGGGERVSFAAWLGTVELGTVDVQLSRELGQLLCQTFPDMAQKGPSPCRCAACEVKAAREDIRAIRADMEGGELGPDEWAQADLAEAAQLARIRWIKTYSRAPVGAR